MKRLYFLLTIHLFIFLTPANANPVILIAKDNNVNELLSPHWGAACNDLGYFAIATQMNSLDIPIPASYVALIICTADSAMTPLRISNVQQYLQNGRSVYIQCERESVNSMNQAFQQLVNTLGGSFSWGTSLPGDFGPLQVNGTFANICHQAPILGNFNGGCSGTGNYTVFPFLSYNGNDYGFSFCPPLPGYGKIIVTSDTGWIHQYTTNSDSLIHNIVYHLFTPFLCGDVLLPVFHTTQTQTNVNCYGAADGSASVTAIGNFPTFTYLWSPGNQTSASISGLMAGTYICTITDSLNNVIHDTFVITQPLPLTAITSQTNILCNGNSTGSATVTVSGGITPYTYSWAPTGGTNPTASNLAAGNYTCTITDSNGCILVKTFTLTEPSALSATTSQTNVACSGYGTATVVVTGGVPGYTYSWAPSGGNAATATNLTSGTYTCTITDANNCVLTKTFIITQPPALTATISHTDIPCFGGNNGTATVVASGGSPAYTYSWAPTGGNAANAVNLAAGSYTCTITDADGCSIVQSAIVTQPTSGLSVFASQTNLVCGGTNTGLATVIVSGGTSPYTYLWAPAGGNGPNAINLAAGNYTCTITDAHGCNTTQAFTLTEPPAIVAATSHADILCYGNNNGIATVLVSGGDPPYTYSWTPAGGNGPNATNLAVGIYTCSITDHLNCVHTETVTITEAPALSTVDSQSNVHCFGSSDGYAEVNPSGGTSPYSYSWAPSGGNANAASGLAAAVYTCTITDYNNCVTSATLSILQPEELSANTSKRNVVCQNLNQGIAIATGKGGIAPYTYLWTPGNSTDTIINGLGVGNYTCLVTDANGCSYRAAFNIVDTSKPFSYSITDSVLDCRTAQLTAIPNAGSSQARDYLWIFSDSVTSLNNPVIHTFPQGGANSVELVIVNDVDCHDTLNYGVNINNPMVADFSTVPVEPLPNTPLHFINSSSPFATIFNWDFGDGTSSTEENPDKTYSDSGEHNICLIANDANNCADTVCRDVNMDIEKSVGVPSAFSPNGDGENDVLYIRGYRLAKVNLRIYNRWGNLVFQTDTKERGWDGTYKGHPQIAEVYAYTLEATFIDGTTKKLSGSISLLR